MLLGGLGTGRQGPGRRHRVMQLGGRRDRPAVDAGLGVGRPKEAGRQLAVLVGAGRRPGGVHVVEDTEERLEVRVAVAAHVYDLVAVLLGADALCRRQGRHQRRLVDVLRLLMLLVML